MRSSSFGVAMMVLLALTVGIFMAPVGPGVAAAQPVSAGDRADASGERTTTVMTDPVTGERYVEVRPTEAIERGRWAVPSWLIWCLGGIAAVVGGGWLTRRMTRARRGR